MRALAAIGAAALLLLLAGCSSSTGDQATPLAPSTSASGEPKVDMRDFAFKPVTLTVAAGTKVTWTNFDPAGHTVTPTDESQWGTEGSGDDASKWLQNGQSWSWTFTAPGTYEYYCTPHASKGGDGKYHGMTGTIIVT